MFHLLTLGATGHHGNWIHMALHFVQYNMLTTLFVCRCLEADSQVDSLEYIKQLLLTLLHTICENMTSRSADEAAVNLGERK